MMWQVGFKPFSFEGPKVTNLESQGLAADVRDFPLRSEDLSSARVWGDLRALLCKYAFMRTTIDLPDPLFRQVKSAAALKGSTLKEFIQEALLRAVGTDRGVRRHRVRLPLIRSKEPGALRLTNADIEDHLARH
jgi:hypothetical protein